MKGLIRPGRLPASLVQKLSAVDELYPVSACEKSKKSSLGCSSGRVCSCGCSFATYDSTFWFCAWLGAKADVSEGVSCRKRFARVQLTDADDCLLSLSAQESAEDIERALFTGASFLSSWSSSQVNSAPPSRISSVPIDLRHEKLEGTHHISPAGSLARAEQPGTSGSSSSSFALCEPCPLSAAHRRSRIQQTP